MYVKGGVLGYGGEGGGADNRHRPKKFLLFDPTRIYKHKVKLLAFICYVESDIHFLEEARSVPINFIY